MLPFLLLLSTAQAACEAPVEIPQLSMMLSDAEAAFNNMDDNYAATSQKVLDALPCVDDVISRELAARIHREIGVMQLQTGKKDRALLSFAAARVLESWYKFPEGHAARESYDGANIDASPSSLLPTPDEGNIRMDGDINLQRPTAVPTLFQLVTPTGQVLQTLYLWPGEPDPSYKTASISTRSSSGGGGLRTVGTVGAVLSTGLLGAGAALWVSGGADYSSDICDESLSPNPHYYGEWCNDSAVPRLGIGRILTVVGGIGLIGSGVTLILSPTSVEVGGTF
jgi:hypothetical protein